MFGDEIDAVVMTALKDGHGDYFASAGMPVALGIELMIEPNLQRVGANGVFLSDAIGITWRKAALVSVTRGGFFESGGKRYIVEETIADDGQWVTAACMVQ